MLAGLMLLMLTASCATSSHKVTGELRPAVDPAAVKVYHTMPAHAQVVGIVSAVSYAGLTADQANEDVVAKLKAQAGKLGANGVVLSGFDDKPMDGAKAGAQAIYVSP
jgi:uncharacterized protein YbjQ (UPF0145 family)